MAKVFVSYKHRETDVRPLLDVFGNPVTSTTARDYVNELESILDAEHTYKGERDDDDISHFTDETIASKLRDQIFDSSVTLILISKNMKESGRPDNDQWIPWEVSYSLREKTREDRRSLPNACVGIVLPDKSGNYDYFVQRIGCAGGCIQWSVETSPLVFEIIKKHMFNRSQKKQQACVGHRTHYGDDHSYIYPVMWDDFLSDSNKYIEISKSVAENIENYEMQISL